jgi:SAM-dependent methyltransferase
MSRNREIARATAREHLAHGDPLGWFEALYKAADGNAAIVPWADLAPNPNLVEWLERESPAGNGRRALKIGCGLGDDAEELARCGFSVTAFDVAPSAIAWARRRFPRSAVDYQVANLLDPPVSWREGFDLVVESYTLQVLPPALRPGAFVRLAEFLAPGGTLLVIARAREPREAEGEMPWPLVRSELAAFEAQGLTPLSLEDYVDRREDPPVRRFRATFRRALA